MAWLLLIVAALLEVVWALALKRSAGFAHAAPATVGIVAAAASVALLALALRSLPVGTAYAVWTGLGAVGVALAGVVLLGESASAPRLALLALLLAAIVGLRLTEA